MRRTLLIAAALSLFLSTSASAQGWIDYVNRADLFAVNFPGEPKVQDITYRTEYSAGLPGHIYSYANGSNRYSVTVVDYSGTEKIHAERLKNCKADLGDGDSVTIPGGRKCVARSFTRRGVSFKKTPGSRISRIPPQTWSKDISYSSPTRTDPERSPRSSCTKTDSTFWRERSRRMHRRRDCFSNRCNSLIKREPDSLSVTILQWIPATPSHPLQVTIGG